MLKPLVLTLKTLLNSYNLCDTYTGGLGSYSLTLMSIALLQVIIDFSSIVHINSKEQIKLRLNLTIVLFVLRISIRLHLSSDYNPSAWI